ncbi:MAG: hypothetical protein ACKVQB_12370, partial [Bacteroidia bacterium]
MKKSLLLLVLAICYSSISYSQYGDSLKPMDSYFKNRSQNITFSVNGGASLFMDKSLEFNSSVVKTLTYERFIFDRVSIQSGFSVYNRMGTNFGSKGVMAVTVPVSIKYYPELQLFNNTFHIDLGLVTGFKRQDTGTPLLNQANWKTAATLEIGGVWIPKRVFGRTNKHWAF